MTLYFEALSDIEAILCDAPAQSNQRHTDRCQPRTRRSTCLVHKCLKTEVDQTDKIGQGLQLIPRRLINVIRGK